MNSIFPQNWGHDQQFQFVIVKNNHWLKWKVKVDILHEYNCYYVEMSIQVLWFDWVHILSYDAHTSCLKHSTHFIFHLNCAINNKTHSLQPNPIENKVDSIECF